MPNKRGWTIIVAALAVFILGPEAAAEFGGQEGITANMDQLVALVLAVIATMNNTKRAPNGEK